MSDDDPPDPPDPKARPLDAKPDPELLARDLEHEARVMEREREREARALELEGHALERSAHALERERERMVGELERAGERAAHEREREAERAAKDHDRAAEERERQAERAAKDHERATEERASQAERAAKDQERERRVERDAKDHERAAKEREHQVEHDAKEQERAAKERERQAEREAKDHERRAEHHAKDHERTAKERERQAERAARELERAAKQLERDAKDRERAAKVGEREAKDRERQAEREADDRARLGSLQRYASAVGDEDDPAHPGHDHHHHDDAELDAAAAGEAYGDEVAAAVTDAVGEPWDWRQSKRWKRFERSWRRQMEQRAQWETRRAEHRALWRQRHRRWRELHEEREMWMRQGKGKRAWGPWWLQAKMRKRIFLWLTLAFAAGAVGMHYWPRAHWWHAVIAMFVLSAVSGMIAFRLTRPLILMIRVAQDIGDGKLETRLDVDRHRGETRLLAMAINEMAERIEQQLKDQRQLLAAVSHELRTPLGHMRVLIDTARVGDARKPLDELEREVLVLDDLVGRLLASSRLEFGNLDCRALDLGELVTDCATAAGVAPEAIEAIGDVRATVDPTLVRRAVANLLDNARVHGGGAVAVRIERRALQIAIEVDDAGPGVPADRRADAFRAFVPSRAGGLGLGLALVSRIAVAHNGGAWITDRPGGGARVGFTVQLAPPAPAADRA